MQDQKAKEFERIFIHKKPKEDEDGLFEPDEEDNMQYEKLDSLAEIDELSPHLFEDEMKENEHLNNIRKEQKEYLRSLSDGKYSKELK